MMKVAIVGMAGRDKTMYKLLTKQLFESMVQRVADRLPTTTNNVVLISGGAAWADHVAVTLFLRGKVHGLELCLPCEWNSIKSEFHDNGKKDWRVNPGRTANQYHRKFSSVIGRSSLQELQIAGDKGASFNVYNGFHQRNGVIADKCDKTISLTWASGNAPTSGGSLDQWRKCKKPKEHISLMPLVKELKTKTKISCNTFEKKKSRDVVHAAPCPYKKPKWDRSTESVVVGELLSGLSASDFDDDSD